MAVHSLTFGDRLVRDIFIPFSQVKTVKLSDSLGPVLMGELHDSGHSRFPVYDGKSDNIIGILYLHDLLKEQHGGSVKSIYHKQVVYAHEEQNLYQTLQAFLKTKRHLFIVVNGFEEVIGIVTIEDVIEQIIGQPIMDEFDQYQDLRAVAIRMADKIHKEQKHETLTPEATEVVE
jgi:CBS domain containing-hemolysin-like protein